MKTLALILLFIAVSIIATTLSTVCFAGISAPETIVVFTSIFFLMAIVLLYYIVVKWIVLKIWKIWNSKINNNEKIS